MATHYSVQNNDDGRDTASEFNQQQYAGAGLQPSVGERDTIPFEERRPVNAAATRVTDISRRTGGRGMPGNGAKTRKTRAVLSRTAAGTALRVEEALTSGRRLNRAPGDGETNRKKNQLYFKALKKARGIINNNSDLFKKGDEILIVENPPETPSFPILIFALAILKDFLDILDVSLIGIIITTITSLFIGVILFFWIWGKASGGWWKKRVIKWLWKRYIMMFILELIPFFKIIPATTIFILMAHNHEKKIVKLANLILEEMYHAGILKRII